MTPVMLAIAIAMAPSGRSCAAPALSAAQATTASGHATALRDAEAKATEDPEQAIDLLTSALDRARADATAVALHPEAAEARQYAMLALARGLIGAEKRIRAAAILDVALATAAGDALPSKLFGPSLVALHDERAAALEANATATLAAKCTGACLVIVDAAWVACAGPDAPAQVKLPPGGWDVVLVDAADASRSVARRIDLAAGESASVLLDVPPPPAAGKRRGRVTPTNTVDDGGRKLPRWAGILGVAIGVVALAAGGALVAIDGNCPDSTDPMGPGACQNILNTDGAGYAMLGIGGASLIGFAIPLGIGESRLAKAKKKAQAGASFHGTGLSIRF